MSTPKTNKKSLPEVLGINTTPPPTTISVDNSYRPSANRPQATISAGTPVTPDQRVISDKLKQLVKDYRALYDKYKQFISNFNVSDDTILNNPIEAERQGLAVAKKAQNKGIWTLLSFLPIGEGLGAAAVAGRTFAPKVVAATAPRLAPIINKAGQATTKAIPVMVGSSIPEVALAADGSEDSGLKMIDAGLKTLLWTAGLSLLPLGNDLRKGIKARKETQIVEALLPTAERTRAQKLYKRSLEESAATNSTANPYKSDAFQEKLKEYMSEAEATLAGVANKFPYKNQYFSKRPTITQDLLDNLSKFTAQHNTLQNPRTFAPKTKEDFLTYLLDAYDIPKSVRKHLHKKIKSPQAGAQLVDNTKSLQFRSDLERAADKWGKLKFQIKPLFEGGLDSFKANKRAANLGTAQPSGWQRIGMAYQDMLRLGVPIGVATGTSLIIYGNNLKRNNTPYPAPLKPQEASNDTIWTIKGNSTSNPDSIQNIIKQFNDF